MVVDEIEAALTDTVETEAMSFGQYHIQIGCREIIGHHLSPILAEDATDPENIKKAKKGAAGAAYSNSRPCWNIAED